MKRLFTLLLLCLIAYTSNAQDYTIYHKGIIEAEKNIFIDKDSIQGLKKFKSVFDAYGFVFVDDCIEAFQLALVFKQEGYAMAFIKKALDNGFELNLLHLLNMSCPCNFASDNTPVTIFIPFIEKNKTVLEAYAAKAYPVYLNRINKDILTKLIKRHVREQLFKNSHQGLSQDFKEQEKEYQQVLTSNLNYIDSLAAQHIFPGERLTGIYTTTLADSLHLAFGTIEDYENTVLKYYGLPANTFVPINNTSYYFDLNPVYNMLFHNVHSYTALAPYKDEAIAKGYLHPREYASLQDNSNGQFDSLHLIPTNKMIPDVQAVDAKREKLLLPDFEIDYNKHAFAHAHQLQLCFGFRNSAR